LVHVGSGVGSFVLPVIEQEGKSAQSDRVLVEEDLVRTDVPVYDIGLMCGVERTEHVGDDGQRLVWGVPKFLVRFPQYLGGGFSRRVLGDRVDPITVTSVSQHWGEPWVGELGKGLGALQECVFCR